MGQLLELKTIQNHEFISGGLRFYSKFEYLIDSKYKSSPEFQYCIPNKFDEDNFSNCFIKGYQYENFNILIIQKKGISTFKISEKELDINSRKDYSIKQLNNVDLYSLSHNLTFQEILELV